VPISDAPAPEVLSRTVTVMIFINVILRKKAILSKYASPKSFGNLVAWRWHRLRMPRIRWSSM